MTRFFFGIFFSAPLDRECFSPNAESIYAMREVLGYNKNVTLNLIFLLYPKISRFASQVIVIIENLCMTYHRYFKKDNWMNCAIIWCRQTPVSRFTVRMILLVFSVWACNAESIYICIHIYIYRYIYIMQSQYMHGRNIETITDTFKPFIQILVNWYIYTVYQKDSLSYMFGNSSNENASIIQDFNGQFKLEAIVELTAYFSCIMESQYICVLYIDFPLCITFSGN